MALGMGVREMRHDSVCDGGCSGLRFKAEQRRCLMLDDDLRIMMSTRIERHDRSSTV